MVLFMVLILYYLDKIPVYIVTDTIKRKYMEIGKKVVT